MSLEIAKITTIEDRDEGQKQVFVDPSVLYPAAVARVRELMSMVKAAFGNLDGWTAQGVTGQMRFALEHKISNAELPLISSFFAVPESAYEDALRPVWELPQATLQPSFEKARDRDEQRLFARRWALDACLALFMREMKDYARAAGFGYNTEIGRDLRYKHAWVSADEAATS